MINAIDPKEKNISSDSEAESPAENDNEPINEPDQVQESNDEGIDKDFPGYPHYPAKDDILSTENNLNRADVDVENISRRGKIADGDLGNTATKDLLGNNAEEEGDLSERGFNARYNPSDVTEEDLLILGDKDQDMDDGEDEELKSHGWKPVTGSDLDTVTNETEEMPGMEDEENEYYSLGGDEKANLDESQE